MYWRELRTKKIFCIVVKLVRIYEISNEKIVESRKCLNLRRAGHSVFVGLSGGCV